ncbi:MAG TPA: glycosyltransferase family A protein [Trueperaceae bacterium]
MSEAERRSRGVPGAVEHPLVSIVLPTFGRPDLLGRAIESVLRQTLGSWELLVVDDNDGGTREAAETRLVVEAYRDEERLRYIPLGANRGGSRARNVGIVAAQGELIAFIDDDDEWLPEKLARQCSELTRLPPEYGAIYCGYFVESNATVTPSVVAGKLPRDPFPAILVDNFVGTTSTLLCRRSIFREIGMFDERMPAAQDRELLIRLCRRYRIAAIEGPLVRFHWHEGSRVTKRRESKLEAQVEINSRYADELQRHRSIRSRFLLDMGKLQLACGRAEEAAVTFLRSWLCQPLRFAALAYAVLASVDGSFYEWVRRSTWRLRHGVGRAWRAR